MDKITIISQLYAIALENGFVDWFRSSAPVQDDTGYVQWLVQTGSFKVIVFSEEFMGAIAPYFASRNVKDPTSYHAETLLKATAANPDPINYLGAFLAEANFSESTFTKYTDEFAALVQEKIQTPVKLFLNEKKSRVQIEVGKNYTNAFDLKGETDKDRYDEIRARMPDFLQDVLTDLARKGAKS